MNNSRKLLDLVNVDVLNRLYNIIYESENNLNNMLDVISEKISRNKTRRLNFLKTRGLDEHMTKRFLNKLYSLQCSYERLMLEINEIVNKHNITVDALADKMIKESSYPGFVAEVFNVLFDLNYKVKIGNNINKENVNSVNYSHLDESLLYPDVETMLKETRNFDDYVELFLDSGITYNEIGDIIFSNSMASKLLIEAEKYICYLLSKRFGTQYEITKFRR